MAGRYVRDAGVWKNWGAVQPYVMDAGTWKLAKAMYRMDIVQTGVSPPTFTATWVRVFDYTPPTQTPTGAATSDPSGAIIYPHQLRVNWTSQALAYPMSVRVFRSTNFGGSFSLVETGAASDTAQQYDSAAYFNANDIGYAELKYKSLDGSNYGPAVNSPQYTF